MALLETFVALVATSLLTGVLLRAYLRYRRRTVSGREWQSFKAQMPAWLGATERVIQLVFFLAIFAGWSVLFLRLHMLLHHARESGPAFGMIFFPGLFGAIAPAMLLGNVVSWLVPPMRRANLAAMEGLGTASFGAAQGGLLKMAAFIEPVCLAVTLLGVWEPWAR